MNIYESLLAKAINGGGGNPNYSFNINGTLAQIATEEQLGMTCAEFISGLYYGDVSAIMMVDGSALGAGEAINAIWADSFGNAIFDGVDFGDQGINMAAMVLIMGSDGVLKANIATIYDGATSTYTNVTPYASMLPTIMRVYVHPML